MECNKEEAFRAKAIAERKMQDKDFMGARKFALKAQQLFPETDNISQMICVCDVHCSGDKKIFGNELDWYGILQVEHTADDGLIKKQYRKFALLLHPDKNKFAGAESAFKLIGEAQRVLLDREKRSFYDVKCRTSYKPVIPKKASQQASKGFDVARQSKAYNSFTSKFSSNVNSFNQPYEEPKLQSQVKAANGKETFWTLCPFCSVRYQYFNEVLNRALRCQSCKKPFIAYDMHGHGSRSRMNTTQPVFPQQNVPDLGASKAKSEVKNEEHFFNFRPSPGQSVKFAKSPKSRQSLKMKEQDPGLESKSSSKANGKRGKKQLPESSGSFESDSSLDAEGVPMNGDSSRAQRRSTRNKRHVSYNENGSDEDALNPSKRAKESGSFSPLTEKHTDASGTEQSSNPSKLFGSASVSVEEGRKREFSNADVGETLNDMMKKTPETDNGCVLDSITETTPEPTFHEYPDPEFCDFDKDREERCFKVGQIWAAYDTVDAMPRFYARIKKIYSPGFKLWITWLEPKPDDKVGKQWANAELPYSCGKFKNGNSESTEDRLMFSHEVYYDKGSGRDCTKIYPRKGETWALFKNWDANWYLIPEDGRKFEYEFVEILTGYDETVGVHVAVLGKLKGFATLFGRNDGKEAFIHPHEILRFSHRVPSYRMTGKERIDVPPGSFELDPASMAMNLEEIKLPKQDVKPCVIDLTTQFDDTDDPADKESTSTNKNRP